MKMVRLVAMDVDGVLTEGQVIYIDGEQEVCSFNIKDGMGLTLARQAGLLTAFISGRKSEVVARRAAYLKISDLYQGVIKKGEPLTQLIQKYSLTREQICYLGDDVNDLPVLRQVGLAVAVADAVEEVRQAAHYVTDLPGGKGAVREVIDQILYQQGIYEQAIRVFI